MPTISYHELQTMQALGAVARLEMRAWGMDRADTVPPNLLRALAYTGGVVIGAWDADKRDQDDGTTQWVGFVMGFPGRSISDHNALNWFLWSHMAAVDPAYQRQGIGRGLKQAQRRWALAQGYTQIRWTFDPMQRRNAHFNLRLLGAYAAALSENHYGLMQDGINRGMPSDRLLATWDLNDPLVRAIADGERTRSSPSAGQFLLNISPQGRILTAQTPQLDAETYFVEVPYDRQTLIQDNRDKLALWQRHAREVLQRAFQAGYRATDFVSLHDVRRCWYVLT